MKICIDPGHGGRDPGAIGATGLLEKDVVLLLSQKVRGILEKAGHQVIMTRENDVYVPFAERVRIANDAKVDIFVSVHVNGVEDSAVRGFETFHFTGSRLGETLARAIHDQVAKMVPSRDRGVKSSRWYVLRYTAMPAVMPEPGFITNAEEEKLFRDDEFLDKLASAYVAGIEEYCKVVSK